MSEQLRTARLEAIAVVQAIVNNQGDDAKLLISQSEDHAELAHAAAGMAASLIHLIPSEHRARIIEGWVTAAVGPDGAAQ